MALGQAAILPSIVSEIVARRVHLKKLLKANLDSETQLYCQLRLDALKQILVCLYGTSGSVWNRFSNVRVFEQINKLSRQILLKTKDIVQSAGFELIYADTDSVFLKKKMLQKKILLHIEADEKLEARKHYYGLTYGGQLITRGIDTRRHDSPTFIKEFQKVLLSKLFDCSSFEDVLTTGYQNALMYITLCIDKIMDGEVQITDLVISKLLRQNI